MDFPSIKAIWQHIAMLWKNKFSRRGLRKGKHQLQPRGLTRNIQSSKLVGSDRDHFSLPGWDNYWRKILS
jgi:hypothetical protein